MSYDLDAIENECAAKKLSCNRVSTNEIEVILEPECILQFANLIEEDDTIIGFKNTPWHSHDELMLMTGDDTWTELSEVDVITSLAAGTLVVVSQWIDGKLHDRWLAHRDEKLDLKHLQPLEELRIKQIAQSGPGE